MATQSLLRQRGGAAPVTNVELFFDLVYVFAVTQLSHYLLEHRTLEGVRRAAILFALVWLVWVYTTWVTNWLDPERIPVRCLLVILAFAGVIMSVALPQAFDAGGLIIGGTYAAIQVGRSAFAVGALHGERLQRNFQRILVWCVVSGVLAVMGGILPGRTRDILWIGTIAVDLLGAPLGFYTPGLGRSTTVEWTVEGNHFAERCQAFILIALGESVVAISRTLSGLTIVGGDATLAFLAAFTGCVALWWIYFDRSADEGARVIAASQDPGRLARSAYHSIHPVMVAGIIVIAAADEAVLGQPLRTTDIATAWLVLGGASLFLGGHALFKVAVWRSKPWSHLVAIILLALLGVFAVQFSAWALCACAAAVVVGVAIADRFSHPASSPDAPTRSGAAPVE